LKASSHDNLQHTRYDAVVTGFYDADFGAVFGGDDRGDLSFLGSLAAGIGGNILEVGAGTGRALVPVAHAAPTAQVVGIEPSVAMRAQAQVRIEAAGASVTSRVTLMEGHFGDIGVPDGSQDLVYTAFRSFQHVLTPAEQLAGLAEVRRVMRPGATLLLDLFDPDYRFLHDADFQCVARYSGAGGTVIERFDARTIDRVAQLVCVDFRWVESDADGNVVAEHAGDYRIRYTFHWELQHLLARAGFEIDVVYGAYDKTPLGPESAEIIVLARRAD
jgi:ubiquinone/menaquinone biosynthesis C-methylase UbiE